LGSAPRGVQTQCFKAPVEFIPVSLGCNHNAGIARPERRTDKPAQTLQQEAVIGIKLNHVPALV